MGLLLSLGNVILFATGIIMRKNTSYFMCHFPALAFLGFLVLLFGISIEIPLTAYSSESKESVIERLRNAGRN